MAIDDLPGSMTSPTRNGERDRWLRDYAFHDTSSDTSDGTQPFVDGSTMADAVMAIYHDLKLVADATDPTKIGGTLLETQAKADGVERPLAVGGSGAVTVSASVGGGTIHDGDELTANGLRFHCTTTAIYHDQDPVPIIGTDTGPGTNLIAGTVMQWTTPAPGIAQNAVVRAQPDGTGLTGGRDEASDDEYRNLWLQERQQRAASGNDTEIQQLAEKVAGVPVQKCFTYPAVLGPCTTCVAFTLKPDTSGSSRIPNPTQTAAVLAAIVGSLPADEGIFAATEIAQTTDVVLKVLWDPSANGWTDLQPWPPYAAATGLISQAVVVQSAADATHFVLATLGNTYAVGTPSPAAGQTIGLYDLPNATFRRKKILTVTGAGPWTIVCDTTNAASDTSYTPVVNQRACPWSDSLQDVVSPIQSYFQTFGPGEQVASFFDAGKRQRRSPQSPKSYPSVITEKGFGGAMENVASLFDFSIVEPPLPKATNVGTPGATCYLIELGYVSAFPE